MANPADSALSRLPLVIRRPDRDATRAPPTHVDYAFSALALGLLILGIVRDPDAFMPGEASMAAQYVVGAVLPVALGLWMLRSGRDQRFARATIGAGVLWAAASLAQAHDPVLYSVGRVAVWLVEPVIVYLILAFPSGQLATTAQRRVVAATTAVACLLYVPSALLGPFPEPSPWSTCTADCPGNAFAIFDGGLVFDLGRALREPLTVVLFGVVAAMTVRRARSAPPILAPVLTPVAVIAVARVVLMVGYFVGRATGDPSDLLTLSGRPYLLSLPAVTLAFAVGLISQRMFAARALQDLGIRLKPHANAGELRRSMAAALRDPELDIVYWVDGDPGRWVDEAGWPVAAPAATDGRVVTEVASDGRRVAAIVHDETLHREPGLVTAAALYALVALENESLTRRLQGSIDDLRESRARIVTAADGERRRIERDLHDGAQQRLVALRIQLALMADRLAGESTAESVRLRDLELQVDATIEEVRSFARTIYPPLLAQRGLGEALRAAGRGAAIATIVDVPDLRRYPLEVESAVYFACVEALQNAAKHAEGATTAWITLAEDGGLRFDVRDNGRGFPDGPVRNGAGLTNIRDRLAAVGGTLEVDSKPGRGTTVIGRIPTG